MKRKVKNHDMRTGHIAGSLVSFAIPLMLTGMLQLFYNAVDVVVVGNFVGTIALSAVGSTAPFINLIVSLFMGLSVGTGVMASRAFGGRDAETMHRTLHTSITISALAGAFIMLLGIIIAEPVLRLMKTPEETMDLAVLYVRIFFAGSIFNLVYNFGSAMIRAVGNTKTPLYFLALSGVLNIALNLFLVLVFNMGVAGVAIATVVSQAFSMYLVLRYLYKKGVVVKLNFRQLKLYRTELIFIMKVGVPAGIQSSLFSISNVLLQSAINTFSPTVIAANTAAGNLEGFIYVGLNSVHQACITFSSQNLGAAQYKRVRLCYYNSLVIVTIFAVVLCSLGYIFSEPLMRLYNSDSEVVFYGIERFQFMCIAYMLWGFMDVTVGQMRGVGSSYLPTIISVCGICILRVFWVMFAFEAVPELMTLYVVYPISWVVTGVVSVPFYYFILKKIPKHNIPLKV